MRGWVSQNLFWTLEGNWRVSGQISSNQTCVSRKSGSLIRYVPGVSVFTTKLEIQNYKIQALLLFLVNTKFINSNRPRPRIVMITNFLSKFQELNP
jgi:hypothetical protein